ncbi:putative General transcription and DNA repair factor IIH subunit tfb2 [Blattamonas nauphoetae]|uniref:General transcription factor IIH subunit 4 n=1 Tax=Blattamonas nauphoetae TaxID=2049346 RepID=A0ABQ9XK19_9EUKA|nr:putative General transcription and DNA repair factor IIH subunit tfb2 [Blattamonas nauphoetae]
MSLANQFRVKVDGQEQTCDTNSRLTIKFFQQHPHCYLKNTITQDKIFFEKGTYYPHPPDIDSDYELISLVNDTIRFDTFLQDAKVQAEREQDNKETMLPVGGTGRKEGRTGKIQIRAESSSSDLEDSSNPNAALTASSSGVEDFDDAQDKRRQRKVIKKKRAKRKKAKLIESDSSDPSEPDSLTTSESSSGGEIDPELIGQSGFIASTMEFKLSQHYHITQQQIALGMYDPSQLSKNMSTKPTTQDDEDAVDIAMSNVSDNDELTDKNYPDDTSDDYEYVVDEADLFSEDEHVRPTTIFEAPLVFSYSSFELGNMDIKPILAKQTKRHRISGPLSHRVRRAVCKGDAHQQPVLSTPYSTTPLFIRKGTSNVIRDAKRFSRALHKSARGARMTKEDKDKIKTITRTIKSTWTQFDQVDSTEDVQRHMCKVLSQLILECYIPLMTEALVNAQHRDRRTLSKRFNLLGRPRKSWIYRITARGNFYVHNKKNVGKKGLGFSGSNFKDDEEEKPATETLTGSAKLSAMRAAFQKQFQPSGVAEQKKEEEKVPFANLEKPKTHVTFDEDDDTPKQETKRDSESESSSSRFSSVYVLNHLPPFGKQLVMRLLTLSPPELEMSTVEQWIHESKEGVAYCKAVFQIMKELQILTFRREKLGGNRPIPLISLSPGFKHTLRMGLEHFPSSFQARQSKRLPQVSIPFLTDYCTERWESVLYIMLGHYDEMIFNRIRRLKRVRAQYFNHKYTESLLSLPWYVDELKQDTENVLDILGKIMYIICNVKPRDVGIVEIGDDDESDVEEISESEMLKDDDNDMSQMVKDEDVTIIPTLVLSSDKKERKRKRVSDDEEYAEDAEDSSDFLDDSLDEEEEEDAPTKKIVTRINVDSLIDGSDARAKAYLSSLHREAINLPASTNTSSGFQFLLEGTQVQIWNLFVRYLHSQRFGADVPDILSFLSRLIQSPVGEWQSFAVDRTVKSEQDVPDPSIITMSLTPVQHSILRDLADLGFVFIPTRRRHTFCTTPLMLFLQQTEQARITLPTAIQGSHGSETQPSQLGGFIIVEPNSRVYAYTSSSLHIRILNIFVNIHALLPNLVVGVINRTSIKRALKTEITADQIINYLEDHAHPVVKRGSTGNAVPDSVSMQIRLWNQEATRYSLTPAVMIPQIPATYFETVKKHAIDKRCYLFAEESTRTLYVTFEGAQSILAQMQKSQEEAQLRMLRGQ